ncbi:MAG: hypothetical protein V1793_07185 [Pseudomonadota bacterium]
MNGTTIALKNERLKGASIFPFFCCSGQVRQLMIILPKADNILMIPFKRGLSLVSFFGVVRMPMDLAQLRSYSNFMGKQIEDLYHYDPDWTLSQERFSKYWARQLIEKSNCVDSIKENVQELQFSRDLSSLDCFALTSGPCMFRTIKPEKLLAGLSPDKPDTDASIVEAAHQGWRLDPIWNDWSKL